MNGWIKSRKEIIEISKSLKTEGKKIVFTNGCFDILHAGHVDYLNKSKESGDVLIVGLNSDSSVKRIKGEKRPVVNQDERAFIISNLKAVDYVTLFEEDTPESLIKDIIPNILVKGADWPLDQIVGRDTVLSHGGVVKSISFINNQSSSNIIKLILDKYSV